MKTFKKNISKVLFVVIAMLILGGCSNYFNNPVEDKETGEDINLLIVDFNFFNTRMTFKLQDATDGSTIYEDAKVSFSGNNGNDIVSFAGEKNQQYLTSKGQLELTSDPNVSISSNSPFEFSVNVEINGYNTLTKAFQMQSEGIKTFELQLAKITDEEETDVTGEIDFGGGDTTFHFMLKPAGLKSATVVEKEYTIGYSTSIESLKKFKDESGALLFNSSAEVMDAYNNDPSNFLKATISSFSHYQSEIDVINYNGTIRSVLFKKLETGKLTKLLIAGTTVSDLNGGTISSTCTYTGDLVPDIFGFAKFNNEYWNILGTNNVYDNLNFSYTLIKASDEVLCETGSSITFKSDVISSFSIDADVFDADGKFITSMNFKGKFPETFAVKNVPSKAVKLVFRNNNPSFNTIAPLEIANFCSGNYDVNVSPATGYTEYQIVLKVLCSSNTQLAIAPTYSAEFRLKNSTDLWQGISLEGGVVDMLGLPDQDYDFRILWNAEWEYATYSTKFDANGNYLGKPYANTKVKSKKLDDGRIQINIEKVFEQNICDDLGW